MQRFSRLPRIVTAAALAAGFVAGYYAASPRSSAATAAGSGYAHGQAVTGGSSAFDWPTFHHGPQRWGLAANSTLSMSNAASLGVSWATDLYGAALDSPVVAWDSKLSKTIAYIGTEQGNLFAVDVATGKIIWSAWLGGPIRSTPVVASGFVWAATWNSPRVFKLDASTGALGCTTSLPQEIEGSPVIATPPGGVQTLYIGTNDNATASGPVVAINTSDCLREWTWQKYNVQSGTWDPIAYAVDAKSRPLVLLGTADPDSSVYAINALTGDAVWRFAATNPPGDFDIGAGITVSLPGINGFADGVAYTVSKYGVIYAIDLTTGAQIWSYNYAKALGVSNADISTPALDGTNLVVGYNRGILDVNAVTGALIWTSSDPASIKAISSPAIAGSPGSEVVAYGDIAGEVDVASLASGSQLYHYQTGGYITASPAVTLGNVLISSSDGFLYDFATGGGNNSTLPKASVTSPADSSTITNPNGNLTISGSASDVSGVAGVRVAIQSGGARGPWWDAATGTWVGAPIGNAAKLASPGATSTGWSLSYPVPAQGGTYQVIAYATSKSGQAGIKAARSFFAVKALPGTPTLTPSVHDVGPGAKLTVTGSGFKGGEQISIALPGDTIAVVTATSTGRIPTTTLTIPAATPFGPATLTATGRTSGRKAAAAIVITNNWDQTGYGPGHVGYEPNDTVLFNLITPGHGIFLDPAWQFDTGGAISTAPAVVNEIAYEGNALGHVVAVDVHNGADRWTWKLASGKAITGSPAVDPKAGLVFAGAADGTLDAVTAANGALSWAASVGGQLNAPVFANGAVYVTSSAGTVEAVSESTGAKKWSAALPAGTTAAPALDAAAGTLVVADSSGDVEGLNAASGATQWFHSSGGAITAAPMITGGTVYVGSGDNVDAISESTGKLLWSFTTGGAVADTPALTSFATGGIPLLLVGSDDGTLYAINGSNGAVQWRAPLGQPIVGVATCDSVVAATTSKGDVFISRTYTNLVIWHTTTNATAGISSPPAIIDGTVYVGGGDGHLYAFTGFGQPPT